MILNKNDNRLFHKKGNSISMNFPKISNSRNYLKTNLVYRRKPMGNLRKSIDCVNNQPLPTQESIGDIYQCENARYGSMEMSPSRLALNKKLNMALPYFKIGQRPASLEPIKYYKTNEDLEPIFDPQRQPRPFQMPISCSIV